MLQFHQNTVALLQCKYKKPSVFGDGRVYSCRSYTSTRRAISPTSHL